MEIITITKLDTNFKYEIAGKAGGENIKKCFSCGTCTAGCPVFQVEQEYNPRKIIRMILLGMREEVLKSKLIWFCSNCYTCSANCPQEVDFSNIIMVLRDIAIKEGYAQPDLNEKINWISRAAQDFRKDCIKLLFKESEISKEQIQEKVDNILKEINVNG